MKRSFLLVMLLATALRVVAMDNSKDFQNETKGVTSNLQSAQIQENEGHDPEFSFNNLSSVPNENLIKTAILNNIITKEEGEAYLTKTENFRKSLGMFETMHTNMNDLLIYIATLEETNIKSQRTIENFSEKLKQKDDTISSLEQTFKLEKAAKEKLTQKLKDTEESKA